ncbi:hypothetical protein COO60DRAFT_1490546 [Scenedesmus sp. NREL 46B-D3]|nr:hypothetical protein COO60DRAFT_1490546 [Scenedesmus sp. NREL 46B-D3]
MISGICTKRHIYGVFGPTNPPGYERRHPSFQGQTLEITPHQHSRSARAGTCSAAVVPVRSTASAAAARVLRPRDLFNHLSQNGSTMARLVVDEEVFKTAARVTSAFLLLLVGCLVWQGLTRTTHEMQARKRKERYERAKDTSLLPIDRTVGNLLEWMPAFLGFFWMSMALTGGATATAGWVYVACRALYPVVAANNGIGSGGAKTPIFFVTVPSYGALVAMASPVIRALFL